MKKSLTLKSLYENKIRNKKSINIEDQEDNDIITVNNYKESVKDIEIDNNENEIKNYLPLRSSVALEDDEKYKGKVINKNEIFPENEDNGDEELSKVLTEHLDNTIETEEIDDDNDNFLDELNKIDEEDEITVIKNVDNEDTKDKAKCVTNQLSIFDNVLSYRIHFQKNNENIENNELSSELYNVLKDQFEIKNLLNEEFGHNNFDEINLRDNLSTEQINDILDEEWNNWKEYRDKTLNSVNKQVQFTKGNVIKQQYKVFNQDPVSQINDILKDKDRLIKRTQLFRLQSNNDNNQRNPDIYDDNDFYQQQLKLLIQRKSVDISLKNGKIRHHTKKTNVDRKASKGRKLRYQVHPKLVSFCAPIPYPPTQIEREQLFLSLFGNLPQDNIE